MADTKFDSDDIIRIINKHLTKAQRSEVLDILCAVEDDSEGALLDITSQFEEIMVRIGTLSASILATVALVERLVPFAKTILRATPLGKAFRLIGQVNRTTKRIRKRVNLLRRAKRLSSS